MWYCIVTTNDEDKRIAYSMCLPDNGAVLSQDFIEPRLTSCCAWSFWLGADALAYAVTEEEEHSNEQHTA